MRRKIDVTADEMLHLRENGLSNYDIAKSLDISVSTVKRYIGNQGCRMERLAAFADSKPKPKIKEAAEMPVIPKYEPKPVLERYCIGCNLIELNGHDRSVTITGDCGEIIMTYGEIPDLVQFLAWAMRERMDVTE